MNVFWCIKLSFFFTFLHSLRLFHVKSFGIVSSTNGQEIMFINDLRKVNNMHSYWVDNELSCEKSSFPLRHHTSLLLHSCDGEIDGVRVSFCSKSLVLYRFGSLALLPQKKKCLTGKRFYSNKFFMSEWTFKPRNKTLVCSSEKDSCNCSSNLLSMFTDQMIEHPNWSFSLTDVIYIYLKSIFELSNYIYQKWLGNKQRRKIRIIRSRMKCGKFISKLKMIRDKYGQRIGDGYWMNTRKFLHTQCHIGILNC